MWVGRRTRIAVRAGRAAHLFRRALVGSIAAAVPGLPFGLRGHRTIALAVFAAWALILSAFLAVEHLTAAKGTLRVAIPFLGAFQFDAVYLLFGLAAAIHIASANEQLRPLLQSWLSDVTLPQRLILTTAASLVVAVFIYFTAYAPLIDS